MAPSYSWRLDLVALGALLAGVLLALLILCHDPALPAEGPGSPQAAGSSHLLGTPGAQVGRLLHETLGAAVYLLLASWFVLVVLLFLRRDWLTWVLRLAGWLILIPCAAVVLDRWNPPWYVGPVAGAGGTLGAWLAVLLETHLEPTGRLLLLGCLVFLGLSLTADHVLVACFSGGWKLLAAVGRLGWRFLAGGTRSGRPKPAVRPLPVAAAPPAAEPEPVPAAAPPAAEAGRAIPIHHHDAAWAEDHGGSRPARRSGPAFQDFQLPAMDLLDDPTPFPYQERDQFLRDQAVLLEKTFADFDLRVRVVGINTGPVITQYEVALETGLRVNKVTVMGDDLALNLKVPSVRIVAPIPGKNTVGIEVPNEQRAVVRLKELLRAGEKAAAKAKIPLFLGKDTEGKPLVYDLAEMPHLLIAGRTGTGKSVCLNSLIVSMLMTRRPDEVKMILIDPKQLELSEYAKIPHLMHPIVKDMKKAEAILAWAVDKMEERYDLLSRARVRNIAGYNQLTPAEIRRRLPADDEEERQQIPEKMPYIVIVIDEMGDLMMQMKKEVEGHIIRLAQKSRAAGIHLMVATQKPTVDVITGLIKSNLPARICFQVTNRSDSRVVLDECGAEKLLGKGDMLFLQPGTSNLVRAQGTYLSDDEIERVVAHLECDEPCYVQELVQLSPLKDGQGNLRDTLRARDEMYEPAIEIVVREGRGSVSLLQRALGIGYGRAARLIDFMAEDGIVGPYNGSNAREVLYTPDQWGQLKGEQPQEVAQTRSDT